MSGSRGGAEGNPPTRSVYLGRANFGDIDGSSRSSRSDDSRTSNASSNSSDSAGLPALVEKSAGGLEVFGELPALQSGRTRSQLRGLAMSSSCADALLTYAIRTVKAERTLEVEAVDIKRAHGSLVGERLEKQREWLKELERRGALLEQREE